MLVKVSGWQAGGRKLNKKLFTLLTEKLQFFTLKWTPSTSNIWLAGERSPLTVRSVTWRSSRELCQDPLQSGAWGTRHLGVGRANFPPLLLVVLLPLKVFGAIDRSYHWGRC